MPFNVKVKFDRTTWKALDVYGWNQPTGVHHFPPNKTLKFERWVGSKT